MYVYLKALPLSIKGQSPKIIIITDYSLYMTVHVTSLHVVESGGGGGPGLKTLFEFYTVQLLALRWFLFSLREGGREWIHV